MSWPPPRPYRGRARPCRCAHARAGAPCRNTMLRPSVTIQNCIATLAPVAPHVTRAAACVAGRWVPYRSHVVHCVVTQGHPPATIQCLYRDSPTSQAPRARCHTPLRASRQCRGPCWPCRRAVSQPYHAVSWFATARPCVPAALPCALAARPYAPAACPGLPPRRCLSSPVSQYSLLYCDSNLEKMGSSPFQLHCTFFCFHSFFFIVPTTGKPPKKYILYFFHFPV